MPAVEVKYDKVQSLDDHNEEVNKNIISTPFGLVLLEIQGELNHPSSVPGVDEQASEQLENFYKVDNIYDAVKFGRLELDKKDASKAILYVGKSQKLIGAVKDLDVPLAVMKIPNKNTDLQAINADGDSIDIVDIIKKKLIFKDRPLPIM